MAMSLVSVIIATFNSERTLPLVLESIRNQSYPQKDIEILIIDGGSQDATRTIARRFNCKVIRNPKVEPLYAKYLGYLKAKGKYIMTIDHDEVLVSPHSIEMKVRTFDENPSVKAVIGSGYVTPAGYGAITKYINDFGDPFSFFMYRLSKHPSFFLATMRSRYRTVKETKEYAVFDLSSSSRLPLMELAAASSVIDGDFFKKNFIEVNKKYYLMDHFLDFLRASYPHVAIIKNDGLLHYSSDTFSSYLQKIVWRVKNNIFYTSSIGSAGFYGRQGYGSPGFRLKKYLFLPYAYTLIGPSVDALYLVLSRKDPSYVIHIPLTLLTASVILYYSCMRATGIKPGLTSYDGSVPAYEKN